MTSTGDLRYPVPVPPPGAYPLLTLEPGYDFSSLLFADVNGDGAVDASATVWADLEGVDGIVFGPLVGQALPRDFSARFDYEGWGPAVAYFGELTGAPPVDVVYIDAVLGVFVIPGPWDGSATPDASWIPLDDWYWLADVDHDGTLDAIDATQAPEALTVTFGPADRFDGPPDVTIDLCRGVDSRGYNVLDYVHPAGDLDGDGDAELSVANYGGYYGADCGGFTVSIPASGEVDPFGGGDGVMDGVVTSAVPIGDWNGDGLPDLLMGWAGLGWGFFAPQGAPYGLLLSPLTFDLYDLGAAQEVPFTAPVYGGSPLPFDRNGDGRPELLVWALSEDFVYEFAVVDSSLDALAMKVEFTSTTAWQHERFVDQGRAILSFLTLDGAWGLDVGAAEPL